MTENTEGSRPEWCVSSMTYSIDTPFWLATLDTKYNLQVLYCYLFTCMQLRMIQTVCMKAESEVQFNHRTWNKMC